MAQLRPKKFKKSKDEESGKKKVSVKKKIVKNKKTPVEQLAPESIPDTQSAAAVGQETSSSANASVAVSSTDAENLFHAADEISTQSGQTNSQMGAEQQPKQPESPQQPAASDAVPDALAQSTREETPVHLDDSQSMATPVGEGNSQPESPQQPAIEGASPVIQDPAPATSSVPPFTPKFDAVNENDNTPTKKKTLLIISVFIALLLIAAGAIFVYFYISKKSKIPFLNNNVARIQPVAISPKVLTPTPTPTVDKAMYSIQILNGSGKVGEASKAQSLLEKGNFTVGNIGNADVYTYKETVIKAKKSVNNGFLASLRKTLSSKYVVATDTATLKDSGTYDVEVVIGSSTAAE